MPKEVQKTIFPEEIEPHEIVEPKTIEEYNSLFGDLRSLSELMATAWFKGDLPSVKRYIRCINKITGIVETKVKKQLWDKLK